MPFEFVCPFCHHRTRVDDKYAGQTGPCANCGQKVTMPVLAPNGIIGPSSSKEPSNNSSKSPRKNRLTATLISIAVATIILSAGFSVYLAIPLLSQKASLAAQRSDSANMIAIAQALNAYAFRHGSYPTPIVKNGDGVPLYSWRVLILPFLGYEDLYKRFQLEQAHDSPANLSLSAEMPSVFSSRFTGAGNLQQTNYALLVGNGTLFPPTGPLSPADAEDPTILLVETTDGARSWTEPGDIDITLGLAIGGTSMKNIGGIHKGVAIVVTVKEKAYAIPETNSQSLVDALVTPQGGETVDMALAVEL